MGNMLEHCCEDRGNKRDKLGNKQSFYNGYTIKPMSHYPGAGFRRRYDDDSESSITDHDRQFISDDGDELIYQCQATDFEGKDHLAW